MSEPPFARGLPYRFGLALVAVVAIGVFGAACGDDDDSDVSGPTTVADPEPDPEPDPEADPVAEVGDVETRIEVSLTEWDVVPESASVAAGTIGFLAANDGSEVHEFVVLRDGEEIAEIEDIAPGDAAFLPVSLEPGTYELACLIRETEPNGEVEDHYELGMHVEFEVR